MSHTSFCQIWAVQSKHTARVPSIPNKLIVLLGAGLTLLSCTNATYYAVMGERARISAGGIKK